MTCNHLQGWVQIRICTQKFGVFELKITTMHAFVFDAWSVFDSYLQIQLNTYKKCQQKVKHCLAKESGTIVKIGLL